MTPEQAEKIANVLIGVAAAGATYYVLKDPALRRIVGRFLRRAMTTSGPWLIWETSKAWSESGARSRVSPAASYPPAQTRAI
jgi:hypothetical protein